MPIIASAQLVAGSFIRHPLNCFGWGGVLVGVAYARLKVVSNQEIKKINHKPRKIKL